MLFQVSSFYIILRNIKIINNFLQKAETLGRVIVICPVVIVICPVCKICKNQLAKNFMSVFNMIKKLEIYKK